MAHSIEVEADILNYNFSQVDIQYMKDVEHIDLQSLLESLNEYCITRNSPLWQQYNIDDVIREGGEKYRRRGGSKRVQFCKHCGEAIYFEFGRS